MHSHWALDKRVIYFPVPTTPELEIIKTESAHLVSLLDEGTPPVAMLVHVSKDGKVPESLLEVRKTATWPRHPHLGLVVLYAENPLFNFAGRLMSIVARMNLVVAESMPDALSKLQQEMPGLDVDALKLNA